MPPAMKGTNMNITKAGIFSVVGRPNVGKSTLVNALIGEKVAIVSNKPQTTRTRITGVLNDGDCQLVFLDTPGLHKPRTRLGDYMVKVINATVADVDTVVLLVEPVARIGIPEQMLIDKIREFGVPAVLVINKIDLAPHVGASLEVMDRDARKMRGQRPFVFANVRAGQGVAEIEAFIIEHGGLNG